MRSLSPRLPSEKLRKPGSFSRARHGYRVIHDAKLANYSGCVIVRMQGPIGKGGWAVGKELSGALESQMF